LEIRFRTEARVFGLAFFVPPLAELSKNQSFRVRKSTGI
jgi:hypothetical protein